MAIETKIGVDVKTLPPFKRFIMSIGALPTSYLESMTYAELVMWFCNFLQEQVIPAVNNNADAIKEIQDFLNTLDLQDEVDHKLDEMAESGQLQEMIAEYLNANALWCFNSVAEMKEATNLIDGSYARTLGYYSKNDGGESLYKVREITNSDVVDEMKIIALNDENLIGELIDNEKINLMSAGCYGDGTHDDTDGVKKAINYAYENGCTLYSADNKTYLINDNLTITNTNLELTNCTFKTDNTITINSRRKNLNLPRLIAKSETSNNVGYNLFECDTNIINVPYIYGFNIGLQLSAETGGCADNNITLMEIMNCLTSIKLNATSTGWVNENIFTGGRIWCDSAYETANAENIVKIEINGTSTHYANNNYFLKLDIEGDEGNSNGLKLKLNHARYNVFENLRLEGTNPKAYASDCRWNLIKDCYYSNNLSFTNEPITMDIFDIHHKISDGGTIGNGYIDFKPSSSAYSSIITRRTDGTLASKITQDGFITYNSSENPIMQFSDVGIRAYINNAWAYMIRNYSKYTLMTRCDGTNGALVIAPGNNTTNGCYLWIYNSHLYGKIGSAPSSESDGNIIL